MSDSTSIFHFREFTQAFYCSGSGNLLQINLRISLRALRTPGENRGFIHAQKKTAEGKRNLHFARRIQIISRTIGQDMLTIPRIALARPS